jgi:prepilin peptidase CpaA
MLLMLPGHLLGGTGAGDVKLLGAAGAILGVGRVPAAFLFTAIAGGLLALLVAMARRRLARSLGGAAHIVVSPRARRAITSHSDNSFPYGPAIAVGSLIAALGVGI